MTSKRNSGERCMVLPHRATNEGIVRVDREPGQQALHGLAAKRSGHPGLADLVAIRGDVHDQRRARWSDVNGRTGSPFRPLQPSSHVTGRGRDAGGSSAANPFPASWQDPDERGTTTR